MKAKREAAGLSMREVARRMLMKSPTYLQLMEKGLRPWSLENIELYERALEPR